MTEKLKEHDERLNEQQDKLDSINNEMQGFMKFVEANTDLVTKAAEKFQAAEISNSKFKKIIRTAKKAVVDKKQALFQDTDTDNVSAITILAIKKGDVNPSDEVAIEQQKTIRHFSMVNFAKNLGKIIGGVIVKMQWIAAIITLGVPLVTLFLNSIGL